VAHVVFWKPFELFGSKSEINRFAVNIRQNHKIILEQNFDNLGQFREKVNLAVEKITR